MKTTLFTGAGASKAIGYPLTWEFLPRVRAGLADGTLFFKLNNRQKERADRDDLQNYLLKLFPGFNDVAEDQLPLITDLFSLVEYAIFSGESLSIGSDPELRRCRDLLKQAITDILLDDFETDWEKSCQQDRKEMKTLGDVIKWMQARESRCGLVTTNYDIGIEFELYYRVGQRKLCESLDIGCDWRDVGTSQEMTRPSKPKYRIYKLHGSLDMLRCSTCGYIYFNPWGTIAHQPFRGPIDDDNTCICRSDIRLELHIVAPSLVREIRDANLLSVWRSALEWMRTSERWVIVGYSLPPEDLAVRSLLLRAYATAEKKPKITVVQMGEKERARYKLLFPGCTYIADGLEGFLARE